MQFRDHMFYRCYINRNDEEPTSHEDYSKSIQSLHSHLTTTKPQHATHYTNVKSAAIENRTDRCQPIYRSKELETLLYSIVHTVEMEKKTKMRLTKVVSCNTSHSDY